MSGRRPPHVNARPAAVLVDGYEVVAASHLDEGLRMVEAERPDLVLVDLDLPGAEPALVDHPA